MNYSGSIYFKGGLFILELYGPGGPHITGVQISRDSIRCSTGDFTCSTRDQTRKRQVADLDFDGIGEGTKILCIKDHVRSSINDFCERIRVITNASFTVGRLN